MTALESAVTVPDYLLSVQTLSSGVWAEVGRHLAGANTLDELGTSAVGLGVETGVWVRVELLHADEVVGRKEFRSTGQDATSATEDEQFTLVLWHMVNGKRAELGREPADRYALDDLVVGEGNVWGLPLGSSVLAALLDSTGREIAGAVVPVGAELFGPVDQAAPADDEQFTLVLTVKLAGGPIELERLSVDRQALVGLTIPADNCWSLPAGSRVRALLLDPAGVAIDGAMVPVGTEEDVPSRRLVAQQLAEVRGRVAAAPDGAARHDVTFLLGQLDLAQRELRHRGRQFGQASQEIGAQRAQLHRAYAHRQGALAQAEQLHGEVAAARVALRLALGLGDSADLGALTLSELIRRHISQAAEVGKLLAHFGAVKSGDNGDTWSSRCWLCGQVDHGWPYEMAGWVNLDRHWRESGHHITPDRAIELLAEWLREHTSGEHAHGDSFEDAARAAYEFVGDPANRAALAAEPVAVESAPDALAGAQ